MRKLLFTAAVSVLALGASAQQITEKELKEIQSSFVLDSNTRALQNILTGEANLKKMALNHQLTDQIDHYFKYKVDVKGITNQYSSGRCWMFTSMNVLRPMVMKKLNIDEFDFSHNYNYFWDIFEKCNLFLSNAIATADRDMMDRDVDFYFKNPIGDGGVWNLFYNVASKYGVVPQSVMPETAHSNNTRQMRTVLNERMRAGGYKLRTMIADKKSQKEVAAEKTAIMKDVYRVLSLCLGVPPTEIDWRYTDKNGEVKTLKTTPIEFFKQIVPENYNPEQYIMIMNDPLRPYYKVYEVQNYRNTYEGVNWVYLNLPNDAIKKAALASIKANEAMYASSDVLMFDSKEGVCHPKKYDYESLLGIDLSMDKKARILTRQSASAHAMTLMAVDTDENDKPVKWQFENSWGRDAGHNGYMTFTDEWFSEYMFRIVINKNYLDSKSIKASKTKPVQLPAWDYMF